MKTSEFIKRVEELGYETDKDNWYVYVRNKRSTVAIVSETRVNAIEANCRYADVPNKLFDLIVEYAKTPLEDREEREEPKRYYLRPKGMNVLGGASFSYNPYGEYWYLENDPFTDHMTTFTLKELEELGIDVEHYDLEEVE